MPVPALATVLIPSIVDIGGKLLERLFPDPNERAKHEYALFELQQKGALAELDASMQTAIAQLQVNLAEAQSGNIWASGWRPLAGWAASAGLVYTVFVQPVFSWVATIYGVAPLPVIESELLWAVTTGMLGLGAYRSYDKTRFLQK